MFPNQIAFGKNIANAFQGNVRSILAVALTQSGKTGSMLALIDHVKHQHAFVITGLSSVEWVQQTKERFPKHLHPNIFHRNQLTTFVKRVKHLDNLLIIIDENQVAFQDGQTIHKSFLDAGLMLHDDLERRNVRIVHFTATPSNADDFHKHNMPVVIMEPPPNYVSAFHLLDKGRIRDYQDLCGIDLSQNRIKDKIKTHAALLKKFEEREKKHNALVKKVSAAIKKDRSLQAKSIKDVLKAEAKILKTTDFLKRSEHMLHKLVGDNEAERLELLIRENENALQEFIAIAQESKRLAKASKDELLLFQEQLRRSTLILGKLEKNIEISDDEHLSLVDHSVFKNIDAIRPFLGAIPKYHIIRTSHTFYHDITIRNFKKRFINSEFLSDMELDILHTKPDKHTFLFIKEKLRCAKTLNKEHLGVLYERITDSPKMDIIVQGLVGRLTGYHRNTNSVVFSNTDLVKEYRILWLNHFKHHFNHKPVLLGTSF